MHSFDKYLLVFSALLNVQVHADDFIFDYFCYKSVSRVNLFSCEEVKSNQFFITTLYVRNHNAVLNARHGFADDFHIIKKMNALGISVAVHHPNSEFYNVSDEIVRKDNWRFGLLLDTRCQTKEINRNIIAQTSQYRLYGEIVIWLILGSSLKEILQLLNDTSYNIQTDLAIGISNGMDYHVYEAYNPSKPDGGSLNIATLGTWDPEKGLQITLAGSKFARRSNLQGMTIKAVAVAKYLSPGMTIEEHLLDYTKKSKDFISKYGYAILLHVGDLFNFTMKIKSHEDWLGSVNGTEVGTFVMMSRGEADILISPASSVARYLTKPYGLMLGPGYPYRTFFVFHAKETEKLKWSEFLTPFALDAWYGVLFTVVLSIGIITAIQTTEYGEGWFAELGQAIFVIIGALSQQGLVSVPNRLAGRIAFLFLLFSGVLLFNYYGASIVSSRLSEPPNKMNDSLYALTKRHMTLTSEPYRYIDILLPYRALTEWEARYFYDKIWTKLPTTKYVSPEEGLSKMGNTYAFHTSPEVAYPYIEAHWNDEAICDMTEVHVITPRILSFWDRVDSPFSELMRVGISKVTDMGLRARNIKRWKPKTPYCSPDARTLESITIFDIAPALMVLISGNALALMICYLEIVTFKLNVNKHTKSKKPRIVGKKTLLRT